MAMPDLPPEISALLKGSIKLDGDKLAAFGLAVCAVRDRFVKARKSSGIEEVWAKCEEQYLAIDDENRDEFSKAKWAKPISGDGPVTTRSTQRVSSTEIRSNIFVPVTSRYVDAGAAKLSEILLPPDDKSFSFGPMPNPELVKSQEDLRQVVHQGMPLTRAQTPEEMQSAGVQQQPGIQAPEQPVTVKDFAQETMDKAVEYAKKAEDRIFGWMVKSQYIAENRKVIFDGARLGTGVLKGPFPVKHINKAYVNGALQIEEVTIPGYKWVDVWNIFPDDSCSEDIHEGSAIVEADFLSQFQVEELKGQDGYLDEQIDKVLAQGPDKIRSDNRNPNEAKEDRRYPVWYFYGRFEKDELDALKAVGVTEGKDTFYAIVTIINDTPVKAVMNPLESGEFPYHAFPWRRRAGSWTGVGVGEQLCNAQRIINSGTRAMLNNAGKSAGSQIVMDRGSITPQDNNWTLTPDKLWDLNPDSSIDDVRKAFVMFEIPDRQQPLMRIIEYGFKLAEESTSIPLITQGQSGPTSPTTLGATQLQDNNANQLLRTIGYAYDEYITEPVVRQSYEMLLLDPEVPEEEKGDFEINAHGSVALVERSIQAQEIMQMGNMVMNPAFGIDPKRYAKQLFLSKKMNPADFQFTEAEQRQKDSQQPPPPIPLQVAQINTESDQKIAAINAQSDQLRVKAETDRDKVFVESETQRDAQNNAADMQMAQAKERLLILEYAQKHGLLIEQVKGQLARTAMIAKTQKEVAGAQLMVDQSNHHLNRQHQIAMKPIAPVVPEVRA